MLYTEVTRKVGSTNAQLMISFCPSRADSVAVVGFVVGLRDGVGVAVFGPQTAVTESVFLIP